MLDTSIGRKESASSIPATMCEDDWTLYVDFMQENNCVLTIEGHVIHPGSESNPHETLLFIETHTTNGKSERLNHEVGSVGDSLIESSGISRFKVELDVSLPDISIEASFVRNGIKHPAQFSFGKFVGLSNSIRKGYWVFGNYIVRRLIRQDGSEVISISANSLTNRICSEAAFDAEILRETHDVKAVAWRLIGCVMRRARLGKKRVWLISDRPMKAGDNGEALFSYLIDNPVDDVIAVYSINRKSEDWKRLKNRGRVVDHGSVLYRIAFLRANLIISSAGDEWVINAFGRRRDIIKDLFGFKYVFLQHGVIKDDLSEWLNRYKKNIRLFVTSAKREYNSVIEGNYGYSETVVKLTGMPRHDCLLEQARSMRAKRIIYIMPTWRKYLTYGKVNIDTGRFSPNPQFCNSHFYKFYQNLLNNSIFNKELEKLGYKAKLVLHPALIPEVDKFVGNNNIEVICNCDYQQAFLEAAMLVTDYSSVAFDYALLDRPIVYAHFDKNEFFENHFYSKGYFSYEKDGFGPICYSLEELIETIVAYLENGCANSEFYRNRARQFFEGQPIERRKTIVEELMKL